MYKIDLRLKTLFPAIIGTRDKHSDIEFRVIAENGIDIDKNAVITITDVANDIYGVKDIYAYKDCIIVEVKRDPDEDDFDEDVCSTDEDNDDDENPYAYFDIHDDKPFYDGPKLVVNNSDKKLEDDIIIDRLDMVYGVTTNKTKITIFYHFKNSDKPLQAQFYLKGDKTNLSEEDILKELNDTL